MTFKVDDTVLIDGTYYCTIVDIVNGDYVLVDNDDDGELKYPVDETVQGWDMCLYSE